jgi:collagenase-like PrtC family protease
MELVCPAGSLPALKAAVDNGADCVYTGLRNQTNARNFRGLNFDDAALREGVAYAHRNGARVFLALNTYPRSATWGHWADAVDRAADFGADAVIVADPGVMQYVRERHPGLRLHLSVQASATNHEAINFYHDHFRIERAVLPRVLALPQVGHLVAHTPVEIEVFGFGGLCVMVEGRCTLSAYATGTSPNCDGACSPASAVRWEQDEQGMSARLNGILIDRFGPKERAGYPTLCKGRFEVEGETYYTFEEPTSLNTLELLPEFLRLGVRAVKIEGRQRSVAYVAQVTRVWRAAIDACRRRPQEFRVLDSWMDELRSISEGQGATLGAYHRPWK